MDLLRPPIYSARKEKKKKKKQRRSGLSAYGHTKHMRKTSGVYLFKTVWTFKLLCGKVCSLRNCVNFLLLV